MRLDETAHQVVGVMPEGFAFPMNQRLWAPFRPLGESGARFARGHGVEVAAVEADFFEVLGAPIVSGRGFGRPAFGSSGPTVIVNESFVERVLDGRNAVGRRLRYLPDSDREDPGPWYEIVGVVKDVATERRLIDPGMAAGVYHPLTADRLVSGSTHEVRMAVHLRVEPTSFVADLRRTATALDPTLRLDDVFPLDETPALTEVVLALNKVIVTTVGLVILIVFLVSASGTYSLMSFTVARRTREIGIRAALGADPRRIVTGILSRALWQIGGGVSGGLAPWIVLTVVQIRSGAVGEIDAEAWMAWGGVAAVMGVVGLVACGVPARRALRTRPTEALKGE